MAQQKRAAQKVIAGQSKRRKTSEQQNHIQRNSTSDSDTGDEQTADPVQAQANRQLDSTLRNALGQHEKKIIAARKRAQEFEKKVKEDEARLLARIEETKGKIETDREMFRDDMLPVFAAAIRKTGLGEERDDGVEVPILLQKPESTPAWLMARQTMARCGTLSATYQVLQEKGDPGPSLDAMLETTTNDKQETERALQAARAFTVSRISARLAEKTGHVPEGSGLSEEDLLLAKKVLSYAKGQQDDARRSHGTAFGGLMRGLGKVVGKMQNLLE